MLRKSAVIAFVLMIATPISVQAQDGQMPLNTFLETASRLEARGPLALLSSDFSRLQREVEQGAASYKRQLERQRAAGETPHSCPPRGGVELSSDALLTHFRSIPANRRARMSVRDAFGDMMRTRYPCR